MRVVGHVFCPSVSADTARDVQAMNDRGLSTLDLHIFLSIEVVLHLHNLCVFRSALSVHQWLMRHRDDMKCELKA